MNIQESLEYRLSELEDWQARCGIITKHAQSFVTKTLRAEGYPDVADQLMAKWASSAELLKAMLQHSEAANGGTRSTKHAEDA